MYEKGTRSSIDIAQFMGTRLTSFSYSMKQQQSSPHEHSPGCE